MDTNVNINQLNNYKNRIDEIYALNLLSSLFHYGQYLPITSSSLNIHSLALIINDIVVNKRESIIEFGSGISTVVLARLIKRNELKTQILSVEEDKNWIEQIRLILEKEGLLEYANLIHAPLVNSHIVIGQNKWYSLEILNDLIPKNKKFDLVIVDGPSAWHPEIELSRYPALPYLLNNLFDKFSFYLDDANRNGEQKILHLWKEKFNLCFQMINPILAHTHRGIWYNISI